MSAVSANPAAAAHAAIGIAGLRSVARPHGGTPDRTSVHAAAMQRLRSGRCRTGAA